MLFACARLADHRIAIRSAGLSMVVLGVVLVAVTIALACGVLGATPAGPSTRLPALS